MKTGVKGQRHRLHECEDGSVPVQWPEFERYCVLIAKGEMTDTEAYKQAVDPAANQKRLSSMTSRYKKIYAKRIEWLRERLNELAAQHADEELLSVVEKRKFCAQVVRAKIGELDGSSNLVEEYSEGESGTRVKMPSKLAAIKMDNDLAGEGAEAESQKAGIDSLAELLRAIRRKA
jgi:hypothetical protein